MSQHRRAGDIADRVNAGHIGLVEWINHDDAALGLDPKFFQTKVLDISDNSNCRDGTFDGNSL
jgi:hypothetical protein